MKHRKKEKIKRSKARVKVRFGIYAKSLEFNLINEILNIKPTNIMLAKDIKIEEFQEDGWEYEYGYEYSTDINEQVEKVLLFFKDKIADIENICNMFNADIQISVIVRAKSRKHYPYLSLSGENIEKMSKLKVSLFDIDLL